jgi:hypothetical protein
VRLLDDEEPGLDVLGDSAYGTGEARAALADAGHQAVIKPAPLRSAVSGGFTVYEFTVDEQAGTVTCPNGITRTINPKRSVNFGKACRHCPLRARCTTSTGGRTLQLRHARRCCVPHADKRTIRSSRLSTGSIGPWSNGRSRG